MTEPTPRQPMSHPTPGVGPHSLSGSGLSIAEFEIRSQALYRSSSAAEIGRMSSSGRSEQSSLIDKVPEPCEETAYSSPDPEAGEARPRA